MLTLGLVVASLLSFASPEGEASDDAVVVVVPAPAPAPPPADWGPSSSVVISQAAPARPVAPPPAVPPPPPAPPSAPSMGIGLYVGSTVAFTLGLAARLNRVDSATGNCGEWHDIGFDSLTQCFDYFDPPSFDGTDLFVGAAYGSSIVLSMVASATLANYQAWETAFGGGRVKNPVSRWAFGAIFTGLGVAGLASHYALIYTDARNPCTTWECNVQRRALWVASSDGSALMLNVGFGLFSWANNYRRNLERYNGMQWSVLPGAGLAQAGATATLRF